MVQLKADPSLLELTPRQSPSQSENGAPGNNTKQLYLLAVVDTSGVVLRLATDDDLKSIPCPAAKRSKPAPKTAAPKPADPAKATLQELLEARKGDGPVCDHCGATESPQWRRGPDSAPVVCNACGTRFRRTGSMGAPIPCYMRKRPADSSATEDGPGAAKTPKPSEKRPNLVSA